jgi:hypothetical protein
MSFSPAHIHHDCTRQHTNARDKASTPNDASEGSCVHCNVLGSAFILHVIAVVQKTFLTNQYNNTREHTLSSLLIECRRVHIQHFDKRLQILCKFDLFTV